MSTEQQQIFEIHRGMALDVLRLNGVLTSNNKVHHIPVDEQNRFIWEALRPYNLLNAIIPKEYPNYHTSFDHLYLAVDIIQRRFPGLFNVCSVNNKFWIESNHAAVKKVYQQQGIERHDSTDIVLTESHKENLYAVILEFLAWYMGNDMHKKVVTYIPEPLDGFIW